ncbi:MAG: urea ABC transporter permease subunit UrtC, partial [Nitrospinaceae bacterium]
MIKKFIRLHSLREWLFIFTILAIAMVLLPLFNILVPEESVLHVPNYMFALMGKYLCYALVALAIDLIWGYTGILSLGHGVFFSMGGYAMGMYLMRSVGKEGVYKSDLPDFMVFLDWKELPWYWYGFDSFIFTLLVILILPALFAFIFGYFAFKSRIKGVYFAIITQAMTFALMLLFFRNETGFGGNNGLTDFKRILGYSLQEPSTKMSLYIITTIVLFLSYILSRYVVQSKLGRVLTAIRDAESRVMFSGYNTVHYKLFIWTM